MIKLTNILKELYLAEGEKQARERFVSSGKITREKFDQLLSIDPTPTKKYIEWMAKQWVNKTVTDLDELAKTIEEYNVFLNKGKAKTKDINAFESFVDLKKQVDQINQSGEGMTSKDLESDYETIIDNEDLLIMVPHTHEASRKLGLSYFAFRDCEGGGKDSAWCTTYKAPDNFNKYYYTANVTFYYIRVKSQEMIGQLKEKFPKRYKAMQVVAIAVLSNKKMDAYDGLDKRLTKKDLDTYINIVGIS